ncbi:hypothetical protein ACIRD8_26095 [Streptomyces sp. NPDC102451]|uniref:hypothetical protein n=1 Tax=Streptomyces sp. NPDC102451 TaxID=3366177 RepID=UPI0037F99AC0
MDHRRDAVHVTDVVLLREQLAAAGTEDVTLLQDSPFGPVFTFTGPQGCRLTGHGS